MLRIELFSMEEGNRRVAELLVLMGELLEISGEEPFKVRAYYRAAEEIGRLSRPLSGMSEKELLEIGGVGKNIAKKIQEILVTGTFHELEELRKGIPPSLIELLEIEGIGPRTVKKLWAKLNITSIEDLERAARAHRIRTLPGFGEKRERELLEAISRYRSRGRRMTRLEADAIVAEISPDFAGYSFEIAGSYRRGMSTVGDIDIVTIAPAGIVNARMQRPGLDLLEEGESKTSLRCRGQRVDIRYSRPEEFGTMLLYFTGSKNFNIRLREIALQRGMKLNEYGIMERGSTEVKRFAREEEIFSFLGMEYVPPELREDRGEIEAAFGHRLPHLVERSEIKGDLHVHSSWSDGHLTLQELAEAGSRSGLSYVLCSDHSSTLGVAQGLGEDALRRQMKEIEAVNRSSGCRVLAGVEVDILHDGTLGLPARILGDLDIVIASIHSSFRQEKDVITRRTIRAMENEHVDIIGHPTGRILGEREPFEIDMGRVIETARDTGTALEINASPYRLDLDAEHVREARDRGVRLAIGTDAHDMNELPFLSYGVMIARRGWCTPGDLLNTMLPDALLESLK